MELMSGYRHSDVGAIPNDWDVLPLGKLVRSVEYGSAAKSDVKGAVPVLRMGNLQGGKIDWSDLVYTDDIDEINKYTLQPGDVLFNRTNTIDLVGKTSIYEGGCPAIFAGYLIRINVVPELLDSRFLNYILNTEFSRKYSAKVLSVAVGQANINGQKLKTYPIPLPPTKIEQEAIATALSDVDALLATLDRMIAKKRDLKQAAMQQLLTGKTRLPGFSDKWEVKTFDEIVETFVGGGTPSRSNRAYWGNEIPWVTVKDFATFNPRHSQEYITKTGLRNSASNLIPKGTLIISTRMALGKAVVYEVDVAINQDLKALFFRSAVSVAFMRYWFDFFGKTIDELGGGSTVKGVSIGELKRLEVFLPKKDEQTAIAETLSDVDAELSALEKRRNKTRNIKQAMMQELLTGKTRLV